MPSRTHRIERSASESSRPGFIEALVDDLAPVQPAPSWSWSVGGWALVSGAIVAVSLMLSGPMRGNALHDLDSFRLALELALASGAALAAIAAGLEIGVPGAKGGRRWALVAAALAGGWLGILFWDDALTGPASSMLGKRPHCFVETLAAAIPPVVLALWLLRRRVVRGHAGAGALVGAAAAALPAIAMQLVCLHQLEHALRFHLSPILLIAALGALAGRWLLPRD